MGSGYRTFTAGEVLSASNVQNYLMDQSVMSFAGSAARSSAIGTANFEEGMVSYLQDTNLVEVYNGTNWASVAPSGPTPGLVQIGTAISFSAVASQSFNDVFSASYRNYKIVASMTCSSDTDLSFRLRVGGSDLSSANSYYYGAYYVGLSSSQAFASINQSNPSNIFVGAIGGWNGLLDLDVSAPFIAAKTAVSGQSGMRYLLNVAGVTNNNETSYTGFSLIPSAGNISGVVNIYGYNA